MPFNVQFEIPGLPPINSADGLNRWARKKHKDRWMREVMVGARNAGAKPNEPMKHAFVTIVRCSRSRPDYDNLVQGGKFLMDGLVHAGLILDDDWDCVGRPMYDWEGIQRDRGKIVILVEESDCAPGFWL